MRRSILKFFFFAVCLVGVLSSLNSCGDKKSKYEVEQKVSGVTWPTMQSYSRWKNIWDNQSWIVALSREQQEFKSTNNLRKFVAAHFAQLLQSEDPALNLDFISLEVSSLLQTHVLAIANFEKALPTGASPLPVFGFGEVRLKGGVSGLQNVLLQSSVWRNKLNAIQLPLEREKLLVDWLWNSLESVPGIEFAEPNLESELQQGTAMPSPSDIEAFTKRIKAQWNTDVIGTDVLVPAMVKGNTTVVAVIDNGVDSAFDNPGSALEGRIYKNPIEDPGQGGQGVDDDGNGWVDDYMGIDATIPKGSVDNGPAPIPGSNDVGGAGKACEVIPNSKAADCGHGTHVAGIIASGPTAEQNPLGVCPLNCKILPIRAAKRCYVSRESKNPKKEMICPTPGQSFTIDTNTQMEVDGGIPDSSQLQAMAYLLDLTVPGRSNMLVASVVNLSLGRYFSSRALSLMSRRLFANDILVIAAAGNQNVEIPMFPAAYRDVLAVCSTSHDPNDVPDKAEEATGSESGVTSAPVRGRRLKSRFSNFGDWVDICAPGSNIRSIVPGGSVELKSGTSQAAPHVAGVAGLLKAIGFNLSAADLRTLVLRYANFDLLYGELDGRLANAEFAFSPYDGVKVFMLGSGLLSAEHSATAITDPAKARLLVSQADAAISTGDTSQVTSGCLVSSLAAHHPLKKLEAWTSPSALLLHAFILLILGRRKRRWNR
jgi:subtilisin family serine protease